MLRESFTSLFWHNPCTWWFGSCFLLGSWNYRFNNVFYWLGDIGHPFLKALVLSPDPRLTAFYFSFCSRIGITLPPHILSMLSLNMGSDMLGELLPLFFCSSWPLRDQHLLFVLELGSVNHFHLFLRCRDKIILMGKMYMFCAYICSLTSFLKIWLMTTVLVRRTILSSGDQEILFLFKTFCFSLLQQWLSGGIEATQQWWQCCWYSCLGTG